MDNVPVGGTDLHEAEPPADGSLDRRATGRDAETDRQVAQKHRAAEVLRNRLLVALSFSAGAIDMIFFLAFGKVFTAFQTGNLVFLGLGVVGTAPPGVILPDVWRVVVSLLAFAVGVMVSARIVRPAEAKVTAWPQRVSVALAITAVAEAAFLVGWILTFGHPTTGEGYVFLGIMGFGMGVQIDAIRSLGVAEVSTTAATATLVRFANDIARRSLGSKDRFLRLRVMAGMAAGAGVGTLVLVHARLYAPALPLLITLVVLVISTTALKSKNSHSESLPPGPPPLASP